MDVSNVKVSDYNYTLPDERIAKEPLKRGHSKLIMYEAGKISHHSFSDAIDIIPENAVLVRNNTRVFNARLNFRKETGASIEIFCLEPTENKKPAEALHQKNSSEWYCLVRNAKKVKSESTLSIDTGDGSTLRAELMERSGNHYRVRFTWDNALTFGDLLNDLGAVPLPPYIKREVKEADTHWYQTVFAENVGSVAAPTASLHFTQEILSELKNKGVTIVDLTLHVSAGTFLPVKEDEILDHDMHAEWVGVNRASLETLIELEDRPIIAMGTTAMRSLESLYYLGSLIKSLPVQLSESYELDQWVGLREELNYSKVESFSKLISYMEGEGTTEIHFKTKLIICPGIPIKVVNGLFTNFHQPQSTLLMLIAAFIGPNWKRVYQEAIAKDYRFLSYGDGSLLIPEKL